MKISKFYHRCQYDNLDPRINVFSDTAQLKHFKFVDFFTDD